MLVGELGRADDVRAYRHHAGIEPRARPRVHGEQRASLGTEKAQEGPITVWVYVDTSKQVGDKEHLKIFASEKAAETWLQENDPEGVAFLYEVME
jgi:hypothetical protein